MKRKIKIGRIKYNIKRVDNIKGIKKRKQKGETVGMIKPKIKTILIKKKGKIIEKETLFHEIAHGFCIELANASFSAYDRAKTQKRKADFKRYANVFCKLNQDEGFVEYFGHQLNKTFKLR